MVEPRRLPRVPPTPGIVVESYGAVVELAGDDRALVAVRRALPGAALLRGPLDRLADGPVPAARVEARADHDGVGEVRVDGALLAATETLDELVMLTVSAVHSAIALHAEPWLFVHAGAVAWRGVGIVIPGRTMAGKSSLVRALVERGATYLSDEYAVLDATGSVHPYTKPLSVRDADGRVRSLDPRSLGEVATGPVRVGLVVATRYRPDARWNPVPVTGARAVLPLIDNTVVARLQPERMLDATTVIVARGAQCLGGERPDAPAIADDLLRRATEMDWAASASSGDL